MFKEIVQDLEIGMNQYGEPLNHSNMEARSRFLAPVSARYIPHFSCAILALTLQPAVQQDRFTLQIKRLQYSRIHYAWYDDKGTR
jgi:hypothetical protein